MLVSMTIPVSVSEYDIAFICSVFLTQNEVNSWCEEVVVARQWPLIGHIVFSSVTLLQFLVQSIMTDTTG